MREYKPKTKNVIATTVIKTPLGDMLAASTKKGICLLSFYSEEEKQLQKDLDKLKKFFDAEIIPAHNKYFECLQKELDEYFNKKRKEFTLPLQLVGTPFQQSVWKILQKIPYGETISYKEEAQLLKNPKATRAVANANGKNPIAIIIPCHRVIASGKKLGGYSSGVDKKVTLLKLEDSYRFDIKE
ncbi:methylated-DNA--[protein]-cysteine S-methyltransferase [Halarcobacter ebronensis]|uniref:Methylated-DNA--protein-cysteine methyltransferase n=1 Tax=Halarcobacter ebronensis TaxID=1462615 RepID=A0A4V1M0V3_9BACT|nr:methylated-DNA--[protein]-cysteine S-methyltransferase [Halarcobacter ebronensis]QKF80650.1 O6-alkylguanine-DNA-alkyltransferase [Halarcobacter ebronensis]RXK08450.1 cysteine methyltransferase [Halarcobacter ebronensis]